MKILKKYDTIKNMLGYVTIAKEELKIKEYDIYQGYYCGICKSIGRRFGQLPRMFLSYDAVFLALVIEALMDAGESIKLEHCIVHPASKKQVMKSTPALDYAADVMVLLAYHKCADDWKDEKNPKALAGLSALKGAYKQLKKGYSKMALDIEEALNKLSQLESSKSPSLDLTCDAFGDIMEALFMGFDAKFLEADHTEIEATKRVLGVLGRNLGKWIYAIDALDDYHEDQKSGSYNPFIYRKSGLEGCEDLLYNYLANVANAWDLLNIKKNKNLIENIIYLGIRLRTDGVLEKVAKLENEEKNIQ